LVADGLEIYFTAEHLLDGVKRVHELELNNVAIPKSQELCKHELNDAPCGALRRSCLDDHSSIVRLDDNKDGLVGVKFEMRVNGLKAFLDGGFTALLPETRKDTYRSVADEIYVLVQEIGDELQLAVRIG
jgi:hypothetical protein